MKPVKSIFDAYIVRGIDSEQLRGSVIPGKLTITSSIINKSETEVETRNTIYKVINWAIQPGFLKDVPF